MPNPPLQPSENHSPYCPDYKALEVEKPKCPCCGKELVIPTIPPTVYPVYPSYPWTAPPCNPYPGYPSIWC